MHLATSYHHYHGYDDLVASHATAVDPVVIISLPGLMRPLRIHDFPSFLVDTSGSAS
jgi:hypothetical protein